MTWTVNFIGHGKLLELHLVTAWNVAWILLLCYSWSTATHPDHGFALTKSEPSPSLSDVHSVVSLNVMGHDHSARSSTQKESERACLTSAGSLTCTYRYLIVNSPHYKVCTINTTDNLQITEMDEFLSISWAIQRSWAKFTSGSNRWTFLSTCLLKHHTCSKMLL